MDAWLSLMNTTRAGWSSPSPYDCRLALQAYRGPPFPTKLLRVVPVRKDVAARLGLNLKEMGREGEGKEKTKKQEVESETCKAAKREEGPGPWPESVEVEGGQGGPRGKDVKGMLPLPSPEGCKGGCCQSWIRT